MSLFSLLVLVLLFVLTEVAEADWRLCFDSYNGNYTSPPVWNQFVSAVQKLPTLSKIPAEWLAAFLLPIPAVLLVTRSIWVQLTTAVLLFFPFAFFADTRVWHDCDRKGCQSCEVLGYWFYFVNLPICSLMLLGTLLAFLIRKARSRYAFASHPG